MENIFDMIERLCPNGVEFKKISEICKNICSGGTPNSKNKSYYNGNIPWLRTQEVNFCAINKTDMKITKDGLANSSAKWIPENSVIVAMYGATVGKVAYTTIPLTTNQACCNLEIDKEKALFKFVYYWLSNCYDYIKSLGQGSQTNINAQIVKDLKIPVPPIEVQREIVRILDEYSEKVMVLNQELQKELELRKKQYSYYRDKLLTFGNDVEYKTLGEIATEFYRGSGIRRDEITENGTPCIRYGEIYTTYGVHFDKCVSHTDENNIKSKKYIEYGDILFAITGESVEDIAKSTAYIGKERCLVGGDIVVMKHNQNPKYLSYALSTTDARMQKSKGKIKSKVVHSNVPSIKEIKIPVPPIEEQERIVKILDRFDTLCNDLTNGIPAEISARQKQYEYYRDKIFSLKRS